MSIFALVGLDSNKDRKTKVKRLYSSLVKTYRQNETIDKQPQNQKSIYTVYFYTILMYLIIFW